MIGILSSTLATNGRVREMSDVFADLGFNENDGIASGESIKFKGKSGEYYRFSLLWWEGLEEGKPNLDSETPRFRAAKRVYVEDVGYVIILTPEHEKLAMKRPKPGIATLVVEWPLKKKGAAEGKIDIAAVKEGEYTVWVWVFPSQRYNVLKGRHAAFHLGKHDLLVKCEDDTYQKLDIGPLGDNMLRALMAKDEYSELVEEIIAKGQSAVRAVNSCIGQELTIDEFREKLGKGTGGGGVLTEDVDSLVSDLEI
jgi:hypothetical protein